MPNAVLLPYLRHSADQDFRGGVQSDGDETGVLYPREDLREERVIREIERMRRRLRAVSQPLQERALPVDDLSAILRGFEEATILLCQRGNDRGIVGALVPKATRALNAFVQGCRRRS